MIQCQLHVIIPFQTHGIQHHHIVEQLFHTIQRTCCRCQCPNDHQKGRFYVFCKSLFVVHSSHHRTPRGFYEHRNYFLPLFSERVQWIWTPFREKLLLLLLVPFGPLILRYGPNQIYALDHPPRKQRNAMILDHLDVPNAPLTVGLRDVNHGVQYQ